MKGGYNKVLMQWVKDFEVEATVVSHLTQIVKIILHISSLHEELDTLALGRKYSVYSMGRYDLWQFSKVS